MEFIKRDIKKSQRNGEIIATSVSNSFSSSGGGGTVSSGVSGNYLPAVPDGEGAYVVNLSKVRFTGSVVAEGEVTAYGSGESGGSTTVGNVTIYDGLDSTDPAVALSAN